MTRIDIMARDDEKKSLKLKFLAIFLYYSSGMLNNLLNEAAIGRTVSKFIRFSLQKDLRNIGAPSIIII